MAKKIIFKVLGWILIIVWILFTLLPLYLHTEQVIVEGSPYVVESYSFEDGVVKVHEYEFPNFSVEERSYKTWFILAAPSEIIENPAYGMGKVVGYFGFLVLGIWLVVRKYRVKSEDAKT